MDVKDAVMIGDSTFDIDMGNRLRMDTIAVTWGSHSKDMLTSINPTHMIDDFSQLQQFA
jgi:phosphoglycolate phosphatase